MNESAVSLIEAAETTSVEFLSDFTATVFASLVVSQRAYSENCRSLDSLQVFGRRVRRYHFRRVRLRVHKFLDGVEAQTLAAVTAGQAIGWSRRRDLLHCGRCRHDNHRGCYCRHVVMHDVLDAGNEDGEHQRRDYSVYGPLWIVHFFRPSIARRTISPRDEPVFLLSSLSDFICAAVMRTTSRWFFTMCRSLPCAYRPSQALLSNFLEESC